MKALQLVKLNWDAKFHPFGINQNLQKFCCDAIHELLFSLGSFPMITSTALFTWGAHELGETQYIPGIWGIGDF